MTAILIVRYRRTSGSAMRMKKAARSIRPVLLVEARRFGVLLLPPIYHSGVVSSLPASWVLHRLKNKRSRMPRWNLQRRSRTKISVFASRTFPTKDRHECECAQSVQKLGALVQGDEIRKDFIFR